MCARSDHPWDRAVFLRFTSWAGPDVHYPPGICCSYASRNYRKRLLAGMPNLNYLDESPCFPKDRRLAEAFMAGGMEAERAMRDQVRGRLFIQGHCTGLRRLQLDVFLIQSSCTCCPATSGR